MKDDFRKIKVKMIVQILIIVCCSALVGGILLFVFVDGIFQRPFADMIVQFFTDTMGMSYDDAVMRYYHVFQNNKGTWLTVGFIVVLIVAFYISLRRFLKYFREIGDGINIMASDKDGVVRLSPELGFMEKKLNQVKADLRHRTREAKDAEQRKNDLVVYLAHDLKTPLTSIIGYLSLIDESPDMPAEQRAKYVGITLDKAYRLEELINEFFDITRFNLQTMELTKTNLDLELMMRQLVEEFYPSLESSNLKATVQINGEKDDAIKNYSEGQREDEGYSAADTEIFGDTDKLSRVFNNIIKNAIAHSYSGTTIIVDIDDMGDNVEVSICNLGDPIPERHLDTIFEKFYRADSSRGTGKGGAGLGLAIAKEIVLAHGGTITAMSDKEGTIFTVILPR